MADETGISWVRNTDGSAGSTFNPWIGCEKVSPGCIGAHCYAEQLVTGRMGRGGTWGADGVRQRTAPGNWRKPVAWNRDAEERGIRRRVFCASLADVFEPRPELEPWRLDLFDLIEQTPHLDWLVLTKRPEVASDWLRARYWPFGGLPPLAHMPGSHGCPPHSPDPYLPNLWLGVSIENARFTWRADVLREIPAVIRFLSCEPLIGSLFPDRAKSPTGRAASLAREADGREEGSLGGARGRAPLDLTGIDWVIVGGESGGPASRPMHPSWFREIRDAVLSLGEERPAFHGKQWGSWAPGHGSRSVQVGYDGRVFPEPSVFDALGARPDLLVEPGWVMHYAGPLPTAGGKLLDGTDWCEIPEPRVPMLA